MWKDYSKSFMKVNRASSISIIISAFISTLFLSLLCSLFYNIWMDDINRIIIEEGDYQGRIIGEIDEKDLSIIYNYANVEKMVVHEPSSQEKETTVDIYFHNPRTIFQDMPRITEQLGLSEDAASYHLLLLSRYLIHDPQDKTPPLLLTFYLFLLLVVSFSLILIIHNSFAVTMNARIHQFGILSSIGVTPRQIRICLMQEAFALCLIPILLGTFLGIALCFGIIQAITAFAMDIVGGNGLSFQYRPFIFLLTILFSLFTVFFSAWLPARKLSKLTPLEAIQGTNGFQLKRGSRTPILSWIFGMEGELASNARKAQKKALRTSTLSLTLSFFGFTLMLCFFSLSDISVQHTYFERYQNVWDVMVTVKDTRIEDFGLTDELQTLQGVQNSIVYQKVIAKTNVSNDWQSEELSALGGLQVVAKTSVSALEDAWNVNAPVVILDDQSFIEYCEQIGISPRLDGAILLNRIWDSVNSNFRNAAYIPFVKENQKTTVLQFSKETSAELPILTYTQEVPILREEYEDYTMVHFIPVSLWKNINKQTLEDNKDVYIRILAKERTKDSLNKLESDISQLLGYTYTIESENRIQEKITNDKITGGYMLLLGAFCSLLALIGIANVFSNTLGFLSQRKREFARYMSIGLTPDGMKKMFCIEALITAGRPILITLPLTIAFIIFAVNASHLDMMEFLVKAPIIPILLFILAILGFVALAYYIGARQMLRCSLTDALRDDTMM